VSTRNLDQEIEVRIRDNGNGISPVILEKIFNPFFTTKPAGSGTGLGLSISYDIIVKQHHGALSVDSVEGEYAEFLIRLPK
jgi:two-component system, NtrC family, sensor kinase